MLAFNPFKSMTFWGAVTTVGSALIVPHFDPTALSDTARVVLTGGGLVLGAVGIRNAVAKAVAQIVIDLAAKTASTPRQ